MPFRPASSLPPVSPAGFIQRLLRACAALVVAVACIAGGEAAAAALKTPTGKPEVTIRNASTAAIFDLIADQMLSSDFMIKSRGENTAVFAKARSPLSGRGAEYRVTYNLVDTAAGVRVMASMVEYVRANTLAEKPDVDFSRHPKTAPGIQAILEHVKKTLESRPVAASAGRPADRAQALAKLEQTVEPDAPCAIPIVGLEIAGTRIVTVIPGGPAERAGVLAGDLLVSIDGQPATTSVQNGARLNGPADTSVLLNLRRGEQQLKIPVIREKRTK